MDGIGSKEVDGVEYLLFVVGALGAHLWLGWLLKSWHSSGILPGGIEQEIKL